MPKLTPEIAVFIFGVLGAIASFQRAPDMHAKARWVKIFFLAGILTQVLAHYFQYSFAVSNKMQGQRDVERSTAIALNAYTRDNVPLLKATTDDSYLIGYRLFKDNQTDAAVAYFTQSIGAGRFVAPSHYLMAYILSHQERRLCQTKDWTPAYEHLQQAISYDPDYSPAYFLRAKLEAASNQIGASIEDLRKAVLTEKSGLSACYDLNDKEKVESEWSNLRNSRAFIDLQRQCKEIHGAALMTMADHPQSSISGQPLALFN